MKKQSVLVCHLKHHPTVPPPYICFLGHMNCYTHVMIRVSLSCYFLKKKFMRTLFLLPHPWPPASALPSPQPEGLRSNQNRLRTDGSKSLGALQKLLAGQQKVPLHPSEGREEGLCSCLLRLATASQSYQAADTVVARGWWKRHAMISTPWLPPAAGTSCQEK